MRGEEVRITLKTLNDITVWVIVSFTNMGITGTGKG